MTKINYPYRHVYSAALNAEPCYVDSGGKVYRPGQTDQAYARNSRLNRDQSRTVKGRPVVWCGDWSFSQHRFRPFRAAAAQAAKEAAALENAQPNS